MQKTYSDPEGFAAHREVVLYLPEQEIHATVFAAVPYDNRHILYNYNFENARMTRLFLNSVRVRKENQMTFIEKIKKKSSDIYTVKPITLAFLGDSVTQGCFELRPRRSGGVDVIYDGESVYHNSLRKIFAMLCPQLPLAVINAGISGS